MIRAKSQKKSKILKKILEKYKIKSKNWLMIKKIKPKSLKKIETKKSKTLKKKLKNGPIIRSNQSKKKKNFDKKNRRCRHPYKK